MADQDNKAPQSPIAPLKPTPDPPRADPAPKPVWAPRSPSSTLAYEFVHFDEQFALALDLAATYHARRILDDMTQILDAYRHQNGENSEYYDYLARLENNKLRIR